MKKNLRNLVIILTIGGAIGNMSFVSDTRASETQVLPPAVNPEQSKIQPKPIALETTWLQDLINAINKIFDSKVRLGKLIKTSGEDEPRTSIETGREQPSTIEAGVGTEPAGTATQETQTDEPSPGVRTGAKPVSTIVQETQTEPYQPQKTISLTANEQKLLEDGENSILSGIAQINPDAEYGDFDTGVGEIIKGLKDLNEVPFINIKSFINLIVFTKPGSIADKNWQKLCTKIGESIGLSTIEVNKLKLSKYISMQGQKEEFIATLTEQKETIASLLKDATESDLQSWLKQFIISPKEKIQQLLEQQKVLQERLKLSGSQQSKTLQDELASVKAESQRLAQELQQVKAEQAAKPAETEAAPAARRGGPKAPPPPAASAEGEDAPAARRGGPPPPVTTAEVKRGGPPPSPPGDIFGKASPGIRPKIETQPTKAGAKPDPKQPTFDVSVLEGEAARKGLKPVGARADAPQGPGTAKDPHDLMLEQIQAGKESGFGLKKATERILPKDPLVPKGQPAPQLTREMSFAQLLSKKLAAQRQAVSDESPLEQLQAKIREIDTDKSAAGQISDALRPGGWLAKTPGTTDTYNIKGTTTQVKVNGEQLQFVVKPNDWQDGQTKDIENLREIENLNLLTEDHMEAE